MSESPVLSIVLEAHLPFVSEDSPSEECFFETVSETFLPLLEVFDRLEEDHVPFKLGLVLSPVLCDMLQNNELLLRYIDYTDRQLDFGLQEIKRNKDNPVLESLSRLYYDRIIDRRASFQNRHGNNIIHALDFYQHKGRIELLATAATHAFLPLYAAYPEAVRAQIETAISAYRECFGFQPQGFWLPEMGWSAALDNLIHAYGFGYTIVDARGAFSASPLPSRGCFYPFRSPGRSIVFARDFFSRNIDRELCLQGACRDNSRDAGYELPEALVEAFMKDGGRRQTGFKYYGLLDEETGAPGPVFYDPQKAAAKAAEQAKAFLDVTTLRLSKAGMLMNETPVCLSAWNALSFGRHWYEGPFFLESLFREVHSGNCLRVLTPTEYLLSIDRTSLETSMPGFSSWGAEGHAETWLDATNDGLYRHEVCALERMIDLAERFPNDHGLKERALNQAARELLLAQDSEWPRMMRMQESADYARGEAETALRNFTTIYEALGASYISTEWLTDLEKHHNFFRHINYRMFRPKQ
jgi:1,4-alpha-glucan branching enzyme